MYAHGYMRIEYKIQTCILQAIAIIVSQVPVTLSFGTHGHGKSLAHVCSQTLLAAGKPIMFVIFW